MLQLHASQGENGPTVHSVQSLADVTSQGEVASVDFNNVTEAAINQDGQLILTGDDGHGNSEFFLLGKLSKNCCKFFKFFYKIFSSSKIFLPFF